MDKKRKSELKEKYGAVLFGESKSSGSDITNDIGILKLFNTIIIKINFQLSLTLKLQIQD